MAVSPADFELYSRVTGRPVPRSPQERMRLAPEVNRFIRNREYERPEQTTLQKGADLLGKAALIGGTLAAAHAIGGGFRGKTAENVGKVAGAVGNMAKTGVAGGEGMSSYPMEVYEALKQSQDVDGAVVPSPREKAEAFLASPPVRPAVTGEQLPTNAFGVPNEAWDPITKKVQGKKVVVRPSLLSEAEKQMQAEKIYGEKLTQAQRFPLHKQYDTIRRDQSSADYPGADVTQEAVDKFNQSRYQQATEESLGGRYVGQGTPPPISERPSGPPPPPSSERPSGPPAGDDDLVGTPSDKTYKQYSQEREAPSSGIDLGRKIAETEIVKSAPQELEAPSEVREVEVNVEPENRALGGKTNAELVAERRGPGGGTLRGRREAAAIDNINKAFDLRNLDRQVTGSIAAAATGATGILGRQGTALVHGGIQPNAGGNIGQRIVDNYWSNVTGMAGEDPILGAIGKGGGLVQQGVQNTSRFRFPDIPIMGEHMQNPFSIRFPSVGNIVGGIYSHIPGHSVATHAAEAVGQAARVGGAELGLLATGIGADVAARGTLAAGAALRRKVDPYALNPWIPTRYEWSQGMTPYHETWAKAYPTLEKGARVAGEVLGSATRGLTNLDVAAQENLRKSSILGQRMYEHDEGLRNVSQFMDSVREGFGIQPRQNLEAPQLPPGTSLDIASGDVNLEGKPINYRTVDHPSYRKSIEGAEKAGLSVTPGSLTGYESVYPTQVPRTGEGRSLFNEEGLGDPGEAVYGRTPGQAQLDRFRDNFANQEIKAQLADNRMAVAEEGQFGGKTQPYAVRISDYGGDFNLQEEPHTQTSVPSKNIQRRKKYRAKSSDLVDRYNRIQAAREARIAEESKRSDDPWWDS